MTPSSDSSHSEVSSGSMSGNWVGWPSLITEGRSPLLFTSATGILTPLVSGARDDSVTPGARGRSGCGAVGGGAYRFVQALAPRSRLSWTTATEPDHGLR